MRSLGLPRCVLLIAPLVAAGLPLPAGADPVDGPQEGTTPGQGQVSVQASAAHLEAELLRRMGGEWVIVGLAPLEPDPDPLAGDDRADPADRVAVQAALHEYRSALESRNEMRLARVWIMNPAELAQVQHLFAGSESIRVSLEDLDLSIAGDRASARFLQQVVVSQRPWWSLALRPASWRSLFARDETGTWALEDVVESD